MNFTVGRMARFAFRGVPFVLAVFAAACGTIRRAQEAKEEVQAVADSAETASASRVNLVGFQLPEFVAFAMTNRPEVISASLAAEERMLAVRTVESGKPFMPHLTAGAGYGQSTANNGPHFSWHNAGKFNANLSLELLLIDFGRYDASFRAACEDLVAAELSLAETQLGVFEDVATSYFTLLLNDALLDVARTNEWECIHHLAQATNRFENGEAKLLDVLRARLDLSEAVEARISASNNTVKAGAEFLRALGLSVDRAAREDVLAVAEDGLGRTL